MCRKAKEDFYNQKCEELEELDRIHSPRLYTSQNLKQRKSRTNQGIKDANGNLLFIDVDILERWKEYIGDLYKNTRDSNMEIMLNDKDRKPAIWIMEEEVELILRELPKNKATGCDKIPAECLQNSREAGLQTLTNIMNHIFLTGQILTKFLKSIFIPFQKHLSWWSAVTTEQSA